MLLGLDPSGNHLNPESRLEFRIQEDINRVKLEQLLLQLIKQFHQVR
jgi:hypothetical protein